MAVDRTNNVKKPYSLQHIANMGFDPDLQIPVVETLGYDGANAQRLNADNLATKITVSGSITYVAIAAPGTAQASALWQVKKIDESSSATTVITWADGNANFDNVATSLASLTYT